MRRNHWLQRILYGIMAVLAGYIVIKSGKIVLQKGIAESGSGTVQRAAEDAAMRTWAPGYTATAEEKSSGNWLAKWMRQAVPVFSYLADREAGTETEQTDETEDSADSGTSAFAGETETEFTSDEESVQSRTDETEGGSGLSAENTEQAQTENDSLTQAEAESGITSEARQAETEGGVTAELQQAEAESGIASGARQAETEGGVTAELQQAEAESGIASGARRAETESGVTAEFQQTEAESGIASGARQAETEGDVTAVLLQTEAESNAASEAGAAGSAQTRQTEDESGGITEARQTAAENGRRTETQQEEAESDENAEVWQTEAENDLTYETQQEETAELLQEVMAQAADFNWLISSYYTIDSGTMADAELLDGEKLLSEDLSLEQNSKIPQILIYHTHSQEAFADSEEGVAEDTIVGMGEVLADELRGYGYQVIHDTGVYDLVDGVLDRSAAYDYAREAVEAILSEYPTIEVIIDLHRDGVDGQKFVTETDGEPTAMIMFFNGLSRNAQGETLSWLENPYLEQNLAFSLQLQVLARLEYSGFTRNIYLKGERYNLHLRPRSLLIEAGTQLNTVEEERNAMKPLADLLQQVLAG